MSRPAPAHRPSAFDDAIPTDGHPDVSSMRGGYGRRPVAHSCSRPCSEPATPMRRRENQLFEYFEVVLGQKTVDLRTDEHRELQSEYIRTTSGAPIGGVMTPPPISPVITASSSSTATAPMNSSINSGTPQAGITGRWRSPSKQDNRSPLNRSPLRRRGQLMSPGLGPSNVSGSTVMDGSTNVGGAGGFGSGGYDNGTTIYSADEPNTVPVSGNFKFRLSDDILFHKVVLEIACLEHAPLFHGALQTPAGGAASLSALPGKAHNGASSSITKATHAASEDATRAHFVSATGSYKIDESKTTVVGKKGMLNATSCSLLHHAHLTLLGYVEESTLLQDAEDGDNHKFQQCIRSTAAVALAAAKKNGKPSEIGSLSATYIKRNKHAMKESLRIGRVPSSLNGKEDGNRHNEVDLDDDEFVTGPPPQELPAGDYNFPFSFDLPRHLPSSASSFFNKDNSSGATDDTRALLDAYKKVRSSSTPTPMVEYVIKASIVYYTEVQEESTSSTSEGNASSLFGGPSSTETDKLLGRKQKEVIEEVRVISHADASQLWEGDHTANTNIISNNCTSGGCSVFGAGSSKKNTRGESVSFADLPPPPTNTCESSTTSNQSSNVVVAPDTKASSSYGGVTSNPASLAASGVSEAVAAAAAAVLATTATSTRCPAGDAITSVKCEYPFAAADYVIYRVADKPPRCAVQACTTVCGKKKRREKKDGKGGFWSSMFCRASRDIKDGSSDNDEALKTTTTKTADDEDDPNYVGSTAEDVVVVRCTLDTSGAGGCGGGSCEYAEQSSPSFMGSPQSGRETNSNYGGVSTYGDGYDEEDDDNSCVAVYCVERKCTELTPKPFQQLRLGGSTQITSNITSPTLASPGGGLGIVEVVRGRVSLERHLPAELRLNSSSNIGGKLGKFIRSAMHDGGSSADEASQKQHQEQLPEGQQLDPARCCNNTFGELARCLRAAVYVYSVTLVPVKSAADPRREPKLQPSKRGCCGRPASSKTPPKSSGTDSDDNDDATFIPVIRKKRITPMFPLTPVADAAPGDVSSSQDGDVGVNDKCVITKNTLDYTFEIPLCEYSYEELAGTCASPLLRSSTNYSQRNQLQLADEHRYYDGALVRVTHGIEIVVVGDSRSSASHHLTSDESSLSATRVGLSHHHVDAGGASSTMDDIEAPSPHNNTNLFRDHSEGAFGSTQRTSLNMFSTVGSSMRAATPERMSSECLDGGDHTHPHPTRTPSRNPLSMNDTLSACSNNDVLGQSVYAFQLTSAAALSPSPGHHDHTSDEASSQTFSFQDHTNDSHQSSPLRTYVPATAAHDDHNDSALPLMHRENSSMTPALSNATAPPTTVNTPMVPKTRPLRVTRQFHTVPLNTVDLTYSVAAINDTVNSKPTPSKFNPSRRGSTASGGGLNSTVGSTSVTTGNNETNLGATNNSCTSKANGGGHGVPSLHERVQAFHELHQREGYLQPYHWDGEKLTLAKKPPPPVDPSSASMTHLPVSLLLEELRPYFDPRNNETYPIVTHLQILLVVPDEAVTAQVSHYAKKVNAMGNTTATDATLSPFAQQQQHADSFPFRGDWDGVDTPLVVGRRPAPPLLTLSPSAINVSAPNTPIAPSPQSTTSVVGGGGFANVGAGRVGAFPGRSQSMASLLSGASTDTTWRQHGCRPRIARLLTRSATRVPRCPSLFLYAAPPGTVAVYPAQPQGNIPIGPTVIVANRRVENPEAPTAPPSSHHSKTASTEEPNPTSSSTKTGSNIIAPKIVQVDYFPYDRLTQEAGTGASYYTSGVSSGGALRRRLQQEKQAL